MTKEVEANFLPRTLETETIGIVFFFRHSTSIAEYIGKTRRLFHLNKYIIEAITIRNLCLHFRRRYLLPEEIPETFIDAIAPAISNSFCNRTRLLPQMQIERLSIRSAIYHL